MIALVRSLVEALAGADGAGVDYVELRLAEGAERAELDAALGEPTPMPRMPGPAFERLAYPGADGVSVFADVDDESGRVIALLVRRDAR